MTAASAFMGLVGTSRPLFWINTAHPFALAFALNGGLRPGEPPGWHWAVFAFGVLSFMFPYNLLMYGVNDVYDYESDLRNPRKGGAQGTIAAPGEHRRILIASSVVTVPTTLVLLALGNLASGAVLLLALFFVVAYSLRGMRFKERPVLDSVTASAHVVLPPAFGMLLAGSWNTSGQLWNPESVGALAAFFIWGVASHAFTAVQDIIPDREGGTPSVATAFGARPCILAAGAGYLIAGGVLAVSVGAYTGSAWWGLAAGALAVPYSVNALRFAGVRDADSQRTTAGYRVFIRLNSFTGAVVTMACIWWAIR